MKPHHLAEIKAYTEDDRILECYLLYAIAIELCLLHSITPSNLIVMPVSSDIRCDFICVQLTVTSD